MWHADENSQNTERNLRHKTYFIFHLNRNLHVPFSGNQHLLVWYVCVFVYLPCSLYDPVWTKIKYGIRSCNTYCHLYDIGFHGSARCHPFIHSFIHSAVCLTTGLQPLPKGVLHSVRSSASTFNFQYPFVSLRWSSGCLLLLPRLPITFIIPSISPSIVWFRRQFLRKMWPIQVAFLLFILCTANLPGFKQT